MVANFTPEILKKCWVFCCLLAPNGSITLQTSSSCGSLTACSRAHSTVQTHAEWATFIISREILFFPPQQPRGGWVTHSPLCYISVPVALHCPPHSWLHSPTNYLLFQLQLHIGLCTVKSWVSFRWYNQLKAFQDQQIIFLCSWILMFFVFTLTFHLSYLSVFNILYSPLRSYTGIQLTPLNRLCWNAILSPFQVINELIKHHGTSQGTPGAINPPLWWDLVI